MKKIFMISILFLITIFASFVWASDSVIVFAGAGMRMPLDKIGKQFEQKYNIKVVYDYEGSGRLGNKILAGQKPDVFIPGGEKWAKILKEKGYVKNYSGIANHLPVIITPLNSNKVNSLNDFIKSDVTLVLGDAKACAIGRTGSIIFKNAGLDESKMNVKARGVTVKQLVRWIEFGNADATLTWHADAFQSDKVKMILIPKEVNHTEKIPVCEMTNPSNANFMSKYIEYLLSYGKVIFDEFGFNTIQ